MGRAGRDGKCRRPPAGSSNAGLARFAWCTVIAVFVLTLPLALVLLSPHHDTDGESLCSPGLIPESVVDALFAWLGQVYRGMPIVLGVAGLGLLVPKATRRPGAWILTATLMGTSLLFSGSIMLINQCD